MKITSQIEIPFPIDWDNPKDRSGFRFKYYELPAGSREWVDQPKMNTPDNAGVITRTIRFRLHGEEFAQVAPGKVIFAEIQGNDIWALIEYKGKRTMASRRNSVEEFLQLFPKKEMVILNRFYVLNTDWYMSIDVKRLRLDLYAGILIALKYHVNKFVARNLSR